jgi:hypothetical protein
MAHHHKSAMKLFYRDAARQGHRLTGANRVSLGNRFSRVTFLENCFTYSQLDHQKNLSEHKRSSVFDHLEWLDLIHQSNVRQNFPMAAKEVAILAPGSMPSNPSHDDIQILKGKRPATISEGPVSSLAPICGKCTWAPFAGRLCRDWIKCFSCDIMGHVARHCEAK